MHATITADLARIRAYGGRNHQYAPLLTREVEFTDETYGDVGRVIWSLAYRRAKRRHPFKNHELLARVTAEELAQRAYRDMQIAEERMPPCEKCVALRLEAISFHPCDERNEHFTYPALVARIYNLRFRHAAWCARG